MVLTGEKLRTEFRCSERDEHIRHQSEAADIALMGDDLGRLPFAIRTARRTRGIIMQNVVGSMSMVVLLILLGAVGSIALPVAVILHEGSTIAVVLNALRLLRGGEMNPEEAE